VTLLPVAKVSVTLVSGNSQIGYAGATNAAGAFHFEGVETGDYQIELARTGYRAGPGSKLHLAPGQTVDKTDLWITPDSGISGKVLGPDGEPLQGARITLIAQKWRRGKRVYQGVDTERTDDAGAYHAAAVAPGRYFVYAARPREGPLAYSILEAPGQPEMRIAGRYHPDSPQLEGAAPVEVRAGEEISGIDLRLPLTPVFHVSGTANAGSPADNMGISLQKRNHDQALEWETAGAFIGKDGSFDIAGVTPGDYFLFSFQSRENDRWVSAKIPLTTVAQDIAGLPAPAVARFEMKGGIRVEDGAAAEAIPVQIFCEGSQDDDYTPFQRRSQPQADGTFVLRGLTADRYAIRVENMETGKAGGFYLKAVRANGVTVAGGEVDMTNGAAENVELILSAGVGSVEGTVKEPAADLTVVVIAESVPSGATRPLTGYLDQDGHFSLTDLEPGSYRAFAVTSYDKGLWQNAEFRRQMADRGTAFDVAEKGSAHIEVKVVPAGEIRQVEERIP
jgi:hypothetical protein